MADFTTDSSGNVISLTEEEIADEIFYRLRWRYRSKSGKMVGFLLGK